MGYNGSLDPFLLESRSMEWSSSQDSASPSVISSPGNGTVFLFLNFIFFKSFSNSSDDRFDGSSAFFDS